MHRRQIYEKKLLEKTEIIDDRNFVSRMGKLNKLSRIGCINSN